MSAGAAARALDVSQARVERYILFLYSRMYCQAIVSALQPFVQTSDWMDPRTPVDRA